MRPFTELSPESQAEVEEFRKHLLKHLNRSKDVASCRFCQQRHEAKQEAARHEAWSLYAKAYDQAEYLRTVEHRAMGEQEATSRFHDRIATAAIKRDEQIATIAPANARKPRGA